MIEYQPQKGLVLKFPSPKEHEEILLQVSKFKPENSDLQKPLDNTQLELFEE